MVKSCRVLLDTTDSFSSFSPFFFALAWETYLNGKYQTTRNYLFFWVSYGPSPAFAGTVGFEASASPPSLTGLPKPNNKARF